jgi:hypothetical protein
MPEGRDEQQSESRRVVAASRALVRRSRDHLQLAVEMLERSQRRLDSARNLLQAVVLRRELTRRRRT